MTFRRWSTWLSQVACCVVASNAVASEGTLARWATFQSEAHQLYAISVQAETKAKRSDIRVSILVDTSASQTGVVRRESLAVLDALIESLPADARVALLACDVATVDLTGGLQKANSSAYQNAREGLGQRVPLGTTNMSLALTTAQKTLGEQPDGVIVYIGDGVNRSNILNANKLESLTKQLSSKRTSLVSLAIGPFYDAALLASLANHSGGSIFIRNNITATPQEIGVSLARAVAVPVFWPERVEVPSSISTQYPKQFPPIRGDRDSIIIGEMKSAGAETSLAVHGVLDGKPADLAWKIKPENSNPDFAFLGAVVTDAERNGGLTLPTPGSDSLRELGLVLSGSVDELVRSGKMALQTGDRSGAIEIANEALKRDPNSVDAASLLEAAQLKAAELKETPKKDAPKVKKEQSSRANKSMVRLVSFQPPETDIFGSPAPAQDPAPVNVPVGQEGIVVPGVSVPGSVVPGAVIPSDLPPSAFGQGFSDLGDGSLLEDEENLRRVEATRIFTEVQDDIRQAQALIQRDPGLAISKLKARQSEVRLAPGLDAGRRSQLMSMLSSALQTASRRDAEYRAQVAQSEKVIAASNAAQRLIAEKERRDASVQQLVQRFNALMEQHQFQEANSDVAPLVNEELRGSVVARTLEQRSAFASNYQMTLDVVDRRRRAYVDSLYLNEAAAIAFVDEPPLVYPPAEAWRALTARREKYRSIDLAQTSSKSEQLIYESLKRKVQVQFNATPLKDIVRQYSEELGIPVFIDEKALLDAGGVTSDEQITLQLPDVSFRSALKLLLEPLELTYVIKDEVMKITTKDQAKAAVMKVYPVGDLVVPVFSGGGMMGGMGGGMGGMGGGMGGMGGGMGGMGGGMGGMGGGMGGMGGGMGGMGGGMFAVNDEPRKTTTEVSPAQRLEEARLILKGLETADEKGTEVLEQKLLKLVGEELKLAQAKVDTKKTDASRIHFQTIVDVISESLRQGFPQPWMYEAMSLSMQACEYPNEDIRRVLLSAVDFSGSSEEALKIAKHLLSKGMKKESLLILEDVSQVEPMWSEPYELGLPLALELDDLEATRWTCVGILKNAWSDDKASLVERAQLAARATYAKLARAKRVMEADAFEKQIKSAMVRDVVVRVTWTGNADLDLAIEEPSGTVCSLNNPRTVSGGFLTGDGSSAVPSKDGSFSETYVCPQGFAGVYRVLVQKAWGEVSGKITVDVLTDYGTAEERYVRKQIALSDKDALLELEVKTGHLDLPKVAVEVAQANTKRVAASRSILTQESRESEGSRSNATLSDFWARQQAALASTGPRPPLRGSVGYMPRLTTLPDGASLSATAVISGDRRYVRVTPTPFFSTIVQVDTFNFIDGSGTTTGGGLGGGGGAGGFGGGGGGGGGLL